MAVYSDPMNPRPRRRPGIDDDPSGALPNTSAPSPVYTPPTGPPPAGPINYPGGSPTFDEKTGPQMPSSAGSQPRDPVRDEVMRQMRTGRTPPTQDDLPPGPTRTPGTASAPPTTPPATPPPAAPPAPGSSPLTQNDRGRWMELAKNYPPTPAGLDQLIKDHPELGITKVGNGDIRLPGGTIIDVIYAADVGGGRWQWLLPNRGGVPGGATPTPTVPSNPFQDQIRQIILRQLQDLSKPYDPNADPQFQIAQGAAESAAERVRRQRQAEAAERLTAQGYSVAGGGGALGNEIDELFNEQSYQLSSLAGTMVQRALQDRRQQLVTLLNMAMSSGDAESARAVQLQLAAIDAELRRMGLAQQQSQFNDTMDLNWAQFDAGLLG